MAVALEDMEEMCRISRFRHLIFRTLSPHIRATAIVQEAGVQVAGTVDHQVVSDFSLARMQTFPSYIFIINKYCKCKLTFIRAKSTFGYLSITFCILKIILNKYP